MKRHCFAMLLMLTTVACSGGTPNASRRKPIREMVRERGNVVQIQNVDGPLFGLREIIEWSPLTIEGVVARAESALREGEGEEYVYTDYLIDVSRTFRAPANLTAGQSSDQRAPWPFIADDPSAQLDAGASRVRLRVPYQGTVHLDGGTITATTNGFPALRVGQHVIVSAGYRRDLRQWAPVGLFEIRQGAVMRLEARLDRDYESVEEFARALAIAGATPTR